MEEIEEILKKHAILFPESRPDDCVKLIYQNEFGGSHASRDRDAAKVWLISEMTLEEANPDLPFCVEIGNHRCRLNLAKAKTVFTTEQVLAWFLNDAGGAPGSMADFMHKLKLFKKNWKDYGYSFTEDECNEYLAWYRSQGYPAVHHSKHYNAVYNPHYRVMYTRNWESLAADSLNQTQAK